MVSQNNDNPFSIAFGMEPPQYIERLSQMDEINNTFMAATPSNRVFMITGVRGSGKTVMLSELSDIFFEKKEWIVINVSSDSDIVNKIAAKLYSRRELKNMFENAKLDFSALGLGVSIESGHQIFDIEIALEEMLAEIKRKKKRVLILIDEIVNNEHVRIFSSTFQLLLRQKLPVFLVMTGLYENIYNLQNEKNLTFLYRAPKIILEPLSLHPIAGSYRTLLGVDSETADYMAKLTKGYPFAYQVLGYLYWKKYTENKVAGDVNELLPSFDYYLENYVYEKIWSELSPVEKNIVAVLNDESPTKVADIRSSLTLSSGKFSVYRDRLSKRGILDISNYGYISLKLPRFREVIRFWI